LKTIAESRNDYVVKVKNNQPNLLKALKNIVENSEPADICKSAEKNRGRTEHREVSVYYPLSGIPDGWTELNRIIYVERRFETPEKLHQSRSYYISSVKSDDAEYFAAGIRGHWHIENRLHYVKDVIMGEDTSGIKNVNAAASLSVFRNMAVNIVRGNGFDSVKNASIYFAGNIKKLLKIMRT